MDGSGQLGPGPVPAPKGGVPDPASSAHAAEWQVAEATALVHTLDGWTVVQTVVVPTKTPNSKLIFGKGNLEQLTGRPDPSPSLLSFFFFFSFLFFLFF